MAPEQIRDRQPARDARVLPLRRGEELLPSSALVRQALAKRASGAEPALIRASLAVAVAVAEPGTSESAGMAGSTSRSGLCDRTGLTPSEVAGAIVLLRETGVLVGTEGALRTDPDLCCSLPALGTLDWTYCRTALAEVGGRLAPALAVLRETARLSRMASGGGGEWITPSVQELTEETLYGRTAVTQALGELVRAGILLRAQQPHRKGLRIRLHPGALGVTSGGESASGTEPLRFGPTSPSPRGAVAGVTVEIGGASLVVPAGSQLRLPEGMDYRLEIGPDGGAIVRIDD